MRWPSPILRSFFLPESATSEQKTTSGCFWANISNFHLPKSGWYEGHNREVVTAPRVKPKDWGTPRWWGNLRWKKLQKFTKCETFTSIYKVGMISSGLCIYIYKYETIYIHQMGYKPKTMNYPPFRDDGNFPLKWSEKREFRHKLTNRYIQRQKAAPAEKLVPKLNELNPARKVSTGSSEAKMKRETAWSWKKNVSLAGGTNKYQIARLPLKMKFLSWLMCFFLFFQRCGGIW